MKQTEYYRSLPRKRGSSGVLFFNANNEVLLVNPTYKEHWGIPGGTIDEEESPFDTAIREVKEELGLTIHNLTLLGIDYVYKDGERGDWYQFIFSGGELTDEQIEIITLEADELSEFKFASFDAVYDLLSPATKERVKQCLTAKQNNRVVYLENSHPITQK